MTSTGSDQSAIRTWPCACAVHKLGNYALIFYASISYPYAYIRQLANCALTTVIQSGASGNDLYFQVTGDKHMCLTLNQYSHPRKYW